MGSGGHRQENSLLRQDHVEQVLNPPHHHDADDIEVAGDGGQHPLPPHSSCGGCRNIQGPGRHCKTLARSPTPYSQPCNPRSQD